MGNYYYLKSGRVITDSDLIIAFEITTGRRYAEDIAGYEEWCKWYSRNVKTIENPDDSTVKDFVRAGYKVRAIRLYRDLHDGCTLAKATSYVESIMEPISSCLHKEG